MWIRHGLFFMELWNHSKKRFVHEESINVYKAGNWTETNGIYTYIKTKTKTYQQQFIAYWSSFQFLVNNQKKSKWSFTKIHTKWSNLCTTDIMKFTSENLAVHVF